MKNSGKKIYIVLTYTGTWVSKLIKIYTKAEYCHVSLALDKNLKEMYSFGRLKPYNPFAGGYVHEGIEIGTFKRFKNTKSAVYSLEVTEKQYRNLQKIIKKMNLEKEIYKFNKIGILASSINMQYKRKNYFYCSEFVKYLIENAGIEMQLPELVRPIDFKYVDNLKLEYEGFLRNYKVINN